MNENIISNDKQNNNEKKETKKMPNLLKSASLVAIIIVLSKLVGFVRDLVMATVYGASTVSDAFFFAYQIPAFALVLLGGVGGPFHSATVAVFSKLNPNSDGTPSKEENKLFNTFLTASFILFTLLAIVFFCFSEQIMQIIISGDNHKLISLASLHLKIMSPILVIGGIIGIYYGILITRKEFSLPNASPIIGSIVTIVLILCFAKQDSMGIMLAWAVTAGSLAMLLLQMPKAFKLGYTISPNLQLANNPQIKTICELLFPAILSSTIGQFHIYIDMFFTSTLQEGAWTAITYANRIFQFPVGVLVTAFLVPLFPIFSKLVAENNFKDIKTYFNKGVGLLFFAAIPIIIAIILLAKDGVALIFQRGAFDAEDTFMVSEALWFLSVSIIPYIFRDSITRIYYSFNDSKTPFVIALLSIALKILLNTIFIKQLGMGIGGITLSTSLITLFNAVMLGILIRKKIKLNYKDLFTNFAKMFVAGLITFLVCFIIAINLDKLQINTTQLEILKIGLVTIICAILYITLNLLFKVTYTIELKNKLVAKIESKIKGI